MWQKRSKKLTVVTVCHDAGGAEIVSAWVKKNLARHNFSCLALGPAIKIFRGKGFGKYMVSKRKAFSIMPLADLVLTGTSWGSKIELEFIYDAKRRAIKTASYVDHWVNYRERFGYPKKNWRMNLPDELWCGDRHALKLAKRLFRQTMCKFVPNAYFQEIKAQCRSMKKQGVAIVFIDEPVRAARKSFGIKSSFKEKNALRALLDYLSEQNVTDPVIIRYHPAESNHKYRALLAKYRNKMRFGKSSNNLLGDIAKARVVIGMKSMGLVAAALCGKKTVSFIPDKKEKCPLPFKKIIKIHNIRELRKVVC